jgi:hypothetical protein
LLSLQLLQPKNPQLEKSFSLMRLKKKTTQPHLLKAMAHKPHLLEMVPKTKLVMVKIWTLQMRPKIKPKKPTNMPRVHLNTLRVSLRLVSVLSSASSEVQ